MLWNFWKWCFIKSKPKDSVNFNFTNIWNCYSWTTPFLSSLVRSNLVSDQNFLQSWHPYNLLIMFLLSRQMDMNKIPINIYLDLSKAFDVLLSKLNLFGGSGIWKLFKGKETIYLFWGYWFWFEMYTHRHTTRFSSWVITCLNIHLINWCSYICWWYYFVLKVGTLSWILILKL